MLSCFRLSSCRGRSPCKPSSCYFSAVRLWCIIRTDKPSQMHGVPGDRQRLGTNPARSTMLWSLPRFGDEALHLHVVPGGFALSFLRVLGQQAPSGRLPIMMPETEADSIPSGPEKAEIGAASRFVRFCSLSVSLRPSQGLRGAQTGVWPGFGRLAGCLSVMSGDTDRIVDYSEGLRTSYRTRCTRQCR